MAAVMMSVTAFAYAPGPHPSNEDVWIGNKGGVRVIEDAGYGYNSETFEEYVVFTVRTYKYVYSDAANVIRWLESNPRPEVVRNFYIMMDDGFPTEEIRINSLDGYSFNMNNKPFWNWIWQKAISF